MPRQSPQAQQFFDSFYRKQFLDAYFSTDDSNFDLREVYTPNEGNSDKQVRTSREKQKRS